jgi:subtilisin-like proprotein convertase family protein
VALAACSFKSDYDGTAYQCGIGGSCPSGYSCVASICVIGAEGPDSGTGGDAGSAIDSTPGNGTWTADSVADFGAAGYTSDGASIAARGALEPAAYYTGGVLERGYASPINDGATATWEQVTAQTPTAVRSLARSTDVSWGTAIPPGVAMPMSDLWTLTFEGEVWLEAGDWTFFLKTDDHGFLDVADAAGTFARVAISNQPNEGSGTVHIATAGWYPLRWTSSDSTGNASMRVRFQGPGFASASSIPRHLLRVRVDQLTGLTEQAFDGQLFDGDRAMTIDATDPASEDYGTGGPVDLGLSGSDNFSERWSGQLWIDVAGSYAFHYQSDDGQRLWLDGVELLDNWDGSTHDNTTAAISLDVGWHDLVVDHTEGGGNARALLTIASGPDLVGQPLPVDRLRPVEGRAERYEHGANHSDISIPDAPSSSVDGSADSTLSFQGPPGGAVHGVEVGLLYDHEWQGDLRIVLIAPSGKTVTLRGTSNNGGGSFYEHIYVLGLDNDPAAGTWTVRFIDTDPGAVGTIRDVELNVHTRAVGAPPIETKAVYVSPVRDLGLDGTIVGQVRWQARQPTGTSVAVQVRTCATAGACASQAWSASLADPTGTTPTVPPGRFVQYQVLLGSTGDAAGSLESIALDYHTP